MKFLLLFLILFLNMCGGAEATLRGKALESKAGLMVNGTILVNFPEREYGQYIGKTVEVTGLIEKDHPWRCSKNPNNEYSQCFDGPAMTKVFSIKILPEKENTKK